MNPFQRNEPVTEEYGVKNPEYQAGFHTGRDFASRLNGVPTPLPVYACRRGKVISQDIGPAYGKHVTVEFRRIRFGILRRFRVYYCHLSRIDVKPGQKVRKGDKLGISGTTGNATGIHLHLETRRSPFGYDNHVLDPKIWTGNHY